MSGWIGEFTAWVFPTCVGVNRWPLEIRGRLWCIPHVRGGEPETTMKYRIGHPVFPTCVGVNRDGARPMTDTQRIPYVRGGEPGYTPKPQKAKMYSPRAWDELYLATRTSTPDYHVKY